MEGERSYKEEIQEFSARLKQEKRVEKLILKA